MSRMLPISNCNECPHYQGRGYKCKLTGEVIQLNDPEIPEHCTLPKEFDE